MVMTKSIRILVVDDEQSVRNIISQVLRDDGFTVTEAADGEEAMAAFEEKPFHLVITDIVMPKVDGIELLEKIKKWNPETQVIIITSHASLDTAIQALRCGAYDYLFKPFEDINLISAVTKRAIEKIRLISENRMLLAKLKDKNMELERRVAERTAGLKKINLQLTQEIKERIRAQDAAETATRAKSEFLANMSHELRTPLNHIIGFTEIIKGKHLGDINEVQGEYLNDVLQSSEHLLALIDDILDLSKIEAGCMELVPSIINLKELLKNSLKIIEEETLKRSIQLTLDTDNVSGSIVADERKLKQIVFNLLSNAVKFTPNGGQVCLSVRMLDDCVIRPGRRWDDPQNLKVVEKRFISNHASQDGNGKCVQISVSDTGIGINPEDQVRVFDRFERINSSMKRSCQGAGLGLTLTKTLVELHGGKIWVDSEGQGKGSVFSFVIPIQKPIVADKKTNYYVQKDYIKNSG